jgi:hypothetical protein
MFGLKVKVIDGMARVRAEADRAAFKNFGHAAASISRSAKSSIERASGPSEPGQPPHTHKRVFLRRAIRYAANKRGAVIGPIASIVGQSAHAHEFGGDYKGTEYPARPFMGPALVKAAPRFAGEWRGSIGR